MRPFSANLGLISEADGSCKFSQGNTCVVAAMYGPTQSKFGRRELHDRCNFEVEFNYPGSSDIMDDINYKYGRLLEASLIGSLCITEYPRMMMVIRVTVVRDDGAAVSIALNACTLALLDSGLPILSIPVSVTTVIPSQISNTMLLDPLILEEKDSDACFYFTFVPNNLTSSSSNVPTVVASHCTGIFTSKQLEVVLNGSFSASLIIRTFIKKIIEEKVRFDSGTIDADG